MTNGSRCGSGFSGADSRERILSNQIWERIRERILGHAGADTRSCVTSLSQSDLLKLVSAPENPLPRIRSQESAPSQPIRGSRASALASALMKMSQNLTFDSNSTS